MQVELVEIIAKYRERLQEATHQNLCYQIAVKKLEKKVEDLEKELLDHQSDIQITPPVERDDD